MKTANKQNYEQTGASDSNGEDLTGGCVFLCDKQMTRRWRNELWFWHSKKSGLTGRMCHLCATNVSYPPFRSPLVRKCPNVWQWFCRTFGSTFWFDLPQKPLFYWVMTPQTPLQIVQKIIWCCSCDFFWAFGGSFLAPEKNKRTQQHIKQHFSGLSWDFWRFLFTIRDENIT